MKLWLYYRLSRDEDIELNSLTNQRKILVDYAQANGHEIAGESFDDNVSGMHFDREGIDKIYEAADAHQMEAVVVKDLSRLGRHKTHTALFIDYLKSKGIRVLSVTESIDTFNENDDLIVGFKGIINDFYARDMSRKIRTGYRQKQKSGLLLTPPMGYFKDRNTGEVVVVEEPAAIVRQIFDWYIGGYGLKAIAKMLNAQGMKSPSYYQKTILGKSQGYHKPEITSRCLWVNTTVRRILTNEFYIGTLVCHKEEANKIVKTRRLVPVEEQFRHENAVPAIITKEVWEQTQFLLADKLERNVRASCDQPHKRYTGLLRCADCGCTLIGRKRKWANNPVRIEYVCNGYHRYGKEHCTPHRIDEATLDKLIEDELRLLKKAAQKNWLTVEGDIKRWAAQKNVTQQRLQSLYGSIAKLEEEIEKILMERIEDKENRMVYDSMLAKRREKLALLQGQVTDIRQLDETIRRRKAELRQSIDLLDDILAEGGISNTHLRMLVEVIKLEQGETGLHVNICLKGQFRFHVDDYNVDGQLIDRAYEPEEIPNNPGWWWKGGEDFVDDWADKLEEVG